MSGDQLLSVNGEDVFGLSHSSVLDILQSCKRFPNQPVKLVVSRQTGPGNVEEADESFSDIDVITIIIIIMIIIYLFIYLFVVVLVV